jgi:AcrR family transcriptional regulator
LVKASPGVREQRVAETRESILAAAERLFAESGVSAVSARQISEAAGQGNNAAVNYHFGTKADVVRAIVSKHCADIERTRERLLAEHAGSTAMRDWVTCLVQPITEHLSTLASPTWYARFAAQVMIDPALREAIVSDTLAAVPLQRALDGLNRQLPALPARVRVLRNDMARQLIVHMCAEHERAVADGTVPLGATWQSLAEGLTDAIVGLLTAPAHTVRTRP